MVEKRSPLERGRASESQPQGSSNKERSRSREKEMERDRQRWLIYYASQKQETIAKRDEHAEYGSRDQSSYAEPLFTSSKRPLASTQETESQDIQEGPATKRLRELSPETFHTEMQQNIAKLKNVSNEIGNIISKNDQTCFTELKGKMEVFSNLILLQPDYFISCEYKLNRLNSIYNEELRQIELDKNKSEKEIKKSINNFENTIKQYEGEPDMQTFVSVIKSNIKEMEEKMDTLAAQTKERKQILEEKVETNKRKILELDIALRTFTDKLSAYQAYVKEFVKNAFNDTENTGGFYKALSAIPISFETNLTKPGTEVMVFHRMELRKNIGMLEELVRYEDKRPIGVLMQAINGIISNFENSGLGGNKYISKIVDKLSSKEFQDMLSKRTQSTEDDQQEVSQEPQPKIGEASTDNIKRLDFGTFVRKTFSDAKSIKGIKSAFQAVEKSSKQNRNNARENLLEGLNSLGKFLKQEEDINHKELKLAIKKITKNYEASGLHNKNILEIVNKLSSKEFQDMLSMH